MQSQTYQKEYTRSDYGVIPGQPLTQSTSSVVLIDDSPEFCALMQHCAEDAGVQMDCFGSLAEMSFISNLKNYDLAVIDFHLKNWCGIEIAAYIDAFLPNLPVVIVSNEDIEPENSWPASIKLTLNKALGGKTLIKRSLTAFQDFRNFKWLERR